MSLNYDRLVQNLRKELLAVSPEDENRVREVDAYIRHFGLKPYRNYYIQKRPDGRLRVTIDVTASDKLEPGETRKFIFHYVKSEEEVKLVTEELVHEWLKKIKEGFEEQYAKNKTMWQDYEKSWKDFMDQKKPGD